MSRLLFSLKLIFLFYTIFLSCHLKKQKLQEEEKKYLYPFQGHCLWLHVKSCISKRKKKTVATFSTPPYVFSSLNCLNNRNPFFTCMRASNHCFFLIPDKVAGMERESTARDAVLNTFSSEFVDTAPQLNWLQHNGNKRFLLQLLAERQTYK